MQCRPMLMPGGPQKNTELAAAMMNKAPVLYLRE